MTDKVHFAIKSFEETDAEYPGSFSLILSDATLDRDGEVVDAKAFSASKSLPPRISMDLDHELTVLSTVGSGVPSYTPDGALQVDGVWASTPKAQEARSLVRDGHIMFASAAFRKLKSTTDARGVKHITDAELLNGTFTQIPSNPSARVLSAKGGIVAAAPGGELFVPLSSAVGTFSTSTTVITADASRAIKALEALDLKVGARNSKSDAQQIQAAHDALVAAGAVCSGEKSHQIAEPTVDAEADEPTVKAAAATAEQAAAATADAAELLAVRARVVAVAARAAVT